MESSAGVEVWQVLAGQLTEEVEAGEASANPGATGMTSVP